MCSRPFAVRRFLSPDTRSQVSSPAMYRMAYLQNRLTTGSTTPCGGNMQNKSNKFKLQSHPLKSLFLSSLMGKLRLGTVAVALFATALSIAPSYASHVVIETHHEKITDL